MIAVILSFAFLAGGAGAEEPALGPLTLERRTGLLQYEDAVAAAMGGDCGPLIAAARPHDPPAPDASGAIPRAEKRRGLMTLEMWDRGLCVAKDPTRGAAIEGALTEVEWVRSIPSLYPLDWRPMMLDRAWRAWHGYGRPRDEALARELIAEGIVRGIILYEGKDYGTTTYLSRPLPTYAARVVVWIREQMATDETRIAFAVGLVKGGVVAPNDTRVGTIPGIGGRILSLMSHSAEANFQLALLLRDGRLGEKQRSTWRTPLRYAARCGHIKATFEMVRVALNYAKAAEEKPFSAMGWLWLLFDRGQDTVPLIQNLAEEHDMSASRDSYLEIISAQEKVPPECS